MGREAESAGTPPSQAISLMERADTIQALPVSTARGSIDLERAHTHSPIKDVAHGVSGRNGPNFAWHGKSTFAQKPYRRCPC